MRRHLQHARPLHYFLALRHLRPQRLVHTQLGLQRSHDPLKILNLFRPHNAHRMPGRAEPRTPPDPMQIQFRRPRDLKMHNIIHKWNMQTPGRHISSHENSRAAILLLDLIFKGF